MLDDLATSGDQPAQQHQYGTKVSLSGYNLSIESYHHGQPLTTVNDDKPVIMNRVLLNSNDRLTIN